MKGTINGKPVEFEADQTILRSPGKPATSSPPCAKWARSDHSPGTCRVCLVELRRSRIPNIALVTSCNTPMEEGMAVLTRTTKVRRYPAPAGRAADGRPQPGLRLLHPPRQLRTAGRRPIRRPAADPLSAIPELLTGGVASMIPRRRSCAT